MTERLVSIGVRQFREDLSSYLDSDVPVAITRHGRTVGYFVPTRRRADEEELAGLAKAVERLEALLAERGISEDEVLSEFRTRRDSA